MSAITIKVNRTAWADAQCDLFKLNWTRLGIADVVFRVLKASKGTLEDGTIVIDALQDVYSFADGTYTGGVTAPSVPAEPTYEETPDATGATITAVGSTTPPGSPADGSVYYVPTGATGVWSGHDGEAASWSDEDAAWSFTTVAAGTIVYDEATSQYITLNGDGTTGPAPWQSIAVGLHAVFVPAAGMTPSATGGCAPLATIASAANQPDIQSLEFDATTQEYAQFSFRMPKSWDEGTITFVPVWSHAATTTNFGVVWDLQAVAVSNDDAIAAAFGTAQTSADTGGTTNDLYIGPESSAITVGGTPASEDVVYFRVGRATANGSDTMAIDARLHGVTVYITTNASNDA